MLFEPLFDWFKPFDATLFHFAKFCRRRLSPLMGNDAPFRFSFSKETFVIGQEFPLIPPIPLMTQKKRSTPKFSSSLGTISLANDII